MKKTLTLILILFLAFNGFSQNEIIKTVTVDADGDEVFTHEELISTPEGGEFTSYPDEADCPATRGQVFTKPGTYTFRYSATDLIDDAPQYDFVVKVDPLSEDVIRTTSLLPPPQINATSSPLETML